MKLGNFVTAARCARLLRSGLAGVGVVAALFALPGCPKSDPVGPGSNGSGSSGDGNGHSGNPTPTATTTALVGSRAAVPTWSAQAERCIKILEDVGAKAEAGDRDGALALEDKAYHEEYENVGHDLEVACRTYLPEEMFEGKMRNVVIAREDAFAQIRGAVKAGAPASKVRSLVDDLSAKIRADATKLDGMPNATPR